MRRLRWRSSSVASILAAVAVAVSLCGQIVQSGVAHAQNGNADEAGDAQLLSDAELDQLVAPIALYPDPLLAQVLIASTYPLEVVEAERWALANKNLKGDQLDAALAEKDWDDGVKALIATPSVLSTMSEKLDWTQQLGDAVLAQQADVMDAVQRLRQRAELAGQLETTEQQTVTVEKEADKDVIVIQPPTPDTVYVPYYDPNVVYGTWPYPSYPPYYYPPAPGYIVGGAIATGIAWGTAAVIGGAVWDSFNWGRGDINVNVNKKVTKKTTVNKSTVNRSKWSHNPKHRGGVRYKNDNVRKKYGKADGSRGRQNLDFRGRDGQQVLKPGQRPGDKRAGDRRADLGDKRPGGGPGVGDKRPGDKRPGADKRPGGGKQQQAALKDRKPDRTAKRPQAKPAGKKPSAFGGVKDGSSARKHASRGKQSLGPSRTGGKRKASRPSGKRPSARSSRGRPSARGGRGGGKRGGGGRRGGGRRR